MSLLSGMLISILSIIGKILLVLLAILLIIILLVLFCPVRYNVLLVKRRGEQPRFKAGLSWLFLKFVQVVYSDKALSYRIYIPLLYDDRTGVFRKSPKSRKKKAAKAAKAFKSGAGSKAGRGVEPGVEPLYGGIELSDGPVPSDGPKPSDGPGSLSEPVDVPKSADVPKAVDVPKAMDAPKSSGDPTPSDAPKSSGDPAPSDAPGHLDATRHDDSSWRPAKGLRARLISRIKGWIRGIIEGIKRLMSALKSFFTDTEKLFDGRVTDLCDDFIGFMLEDDTVYTVDTIKAALTSLVRIIRPRHLQGRLKFGFDDPSHTGSVLCALSVLYPLYGDGVRIKPDFNNRVLSGKLKAEGAVRLFFIVVLLLKLFFDKKIKVCYGKIKKLKSRLGDLSQA